MRRIDTGKSGEKIAMNFLKKKGYRILETNFRCREGEIDIVAEQKDYLVFVEVYTEPDSQQHRYAHYDIDNSEVL